MGTFQRFIPFPICKQRHPRWNYCWWWSLSTNDWFHKVKTGTCFRRSQWLLIFEQSSQHFMIRIVFMFFAWFSKRSYFPFLLLLEPFTKIHSKYKRKQAMYVYWFLIERVKVLRHNNHAEWQVNKVWTFNHHTHCWYFPFRPNFS